MVKLSIITINLNNAEGLLRTIKSVISQTFNDYEYIIIDGESNDDSISVITAYKEFISKWVSEKDSGIYQAMNKGIRMADGDYICFVNSGDVFFSPYILETVSYFIKQKDAELFFSDCLLFDETNTGLDFKRIINSSLVKSKPDLLKIPLPHPSTYYSRKLFNEIGFFDENFKIVSDMDWYLNALINHKIRFFSIGIITSAFFLGGLSTSQKETHQREYNLMLRKYFSPFEIRLFSGRTFSKIHKFPILKTALSGLLNLRLNKIY
jgi:glycosyltransferase involved in cell wall biosynthesis